MTAREYARSVLDGSTVAGPHVRDSCKRFENDLAASPQSGYWYDESEEEHMAEFYREELVLIEGKYSGKPFELEPMWRFCVGNLMCWFRLDDDGEIVRRFTDCYIETAKGTAKTPTMAGLADYLLACDGEHAALIYWFAADSAQASVGFKVATAFSENSPTLSEITRPIGGSNPNKILYEGTRSEMLKLAGKAKGKSGGIPSAVFADELHEHDSPDTLDLLRANIKGSRLQPIVVTMTNSGIGREGNWVYERSMYSRDVAAGTIEDDAHFSYVAALDQGDDPWNDESVWVKACPTLPKLPGLTEIRKEVKEAKQQPSKRATTARLRFCIWADESSTPAFTREMWMPCEVDKLSPYEKRKDRPCFLSLDLAKRRDLTAANAVWEMGDGSFETEAFPWLPKDAVPLFRQQVSRGVDGWVDDKDLLLAPGPVMDYSFVAAWMKNMIDRYNVVCIVSDDWGTIDLRNEMRKLSLPVEAVESCKPADVTSGEIPMLFHPQGYQRPIKSKDALQLSMHLGIERLSEAMLTKRLKAKRNKVLRWSVLGVATEADNRQNSYLAKKSKAKIDPAVALTMGVGAARAWREVEGSEFQVLDIF